MSDVTWLALLIAGVLAYCVALNMAGALTGAWIAASS